MTRFLYRLWFGLRREDAHYLLALDGPIEKDPGKDIMTPIGEFRAGINKLLVNDEVTAVEEVVMKAIAAMNSEKVLLYDVFPERILEKSEKHDLDVWAVPNFARHLVGKEPDLIRKNRELMATCYGNGGVAWEYDNDDRPTDDDTH